MSLHTIVFIVGLIAIIIGLKRPWLGGLAGLIAFTLMFYLGACTNCVGGNGMRRSTLMFLLWTDCDRYSYTDVFIGR